MSDLQSYHHDPSTLLHQTRRHFFQNCQLGVGAMGLASLFQGNSLAVGPNEPAPVDPSLPPGSRVGAKAGYDLTWPFGTANRLEVRVPAPTAPVTCTPGDRHHVPADHALAPPPEPPRYQLHPHRRHHEQHHGGGGACVRAIRYADREEQRPA